MTIEECREMLEDVRRKKSRARRLQSQIEEYKSNLDALCLPSALGASDGGRTGTVHSRVEQIVIRLEDRREDFMTALDEALTAEDNLRDAIQTLTIEEQDVIIECYMCGKTAIRVAQEMCYSRETIFRRKGTAIKKIARNLQS